MLYLQYSTSVITTGTTKTLFPKQPTIIKETQFDTFYTVLQNKIHPLHLKLQLSLLVNTSPTNHQLLCSSRLLDADCWFSCFWTKLLMAFFFSQNISKFSLEPAVLPAQQLNQSALPHLAGLTWCRPDAPALNSKYSSS